MGGNTDRKITGLLFDAGIVTAVKAGHSEFTSGVLNDPEQLKIIADALEFDPRLLSIRVREALANEELSKIEHELREISQR